MTGVFERDISFVAWTLFSIVLMNETIQTFRVLAMSLFETDWHFRYFNC
jgi:hypothetical protein